MKIRLFLVTVIFTLTLCACSIEENERELDAQEISEEEKEKEEQEESEVEEEEEEEDKKKSKEYEEVIASEEIEMYKVLFENADTFSEIAVNETKAAKIMADGGFGDEINKVFQALDAHGKPLGYVVQLTIKDGYSESIVMLVGIRVDGVVNGYSVISHGETPGLGTKAFDTAYVEQFKGIAITDVSAVDTISGATITSTAVINGINAVGDYLSSLGAIQ